MTDEGSELLHHRTEFDDWRSLTIGIYMALAGYAAFFACTDLLDQFSETLVLV